MHFTKLIPNLFYADIQTGLTLFADCLGFTIGYNDLASAGPSCIVEKDGLALFLIQSKEYADKDRPELRLQTSNIEAAYDEIKRSHPALLHPNGKSISLKPWGAKEFALLDESGVCIIIQQF